MSLAATKLDSVSSQQAGVPAAIGFFFAFRLCFAFVAFQSQPVVATAVSLALSFMFAFFAWTISSSAEASVARPRTLRWVWAYLALVATSLLWSATGSTAAALGYWAGLAADCVSVYLLTRTNESAQRCYSITNGFAVGAALVGLIAWFAPTLPDLRIGNEDFLHPNALGYTLAIATLFAIHSARHSRFMACIALVCGVTLLRTLSKASIAAFAASFVFYLLRNSHMSRRSKVSIGIAAGLLIAASWGLVEAYVETYGQTYHVETLTGRTYIWAVAWEEGLKSPWLGRGFYAFRYVVPVLGDFEPWQAHNEFLQQFFSYGVLGVGIVVGLYAAFVRLIRRNHSNEFATLAASLMVFVLIRGLVDTERFDLNYPLWLLTLFIMALSPPTLEPQ